MSKLDLDIQKISYLNDDTFQANHLHINFKGKSINHVVLNTLRRIMLEDIPCLSFNSELIEIIKNSSVYNNDYMRNRLENLPLININFKLDLDEYDILRKYTRGTKSYEENLEVKDEEAEDVKTESFFTMYCKKRNDKDIILDITSDDVEFYNQEKRINTIYKNPILITKLKPHEEIEFTAKADKGIAMNNSRYAVVGACCYELINENEFILKFEPRGQLAVKEILLRSFTLIKFRLQQILNKINKIKFTSDNHGKIILNNEDHTFGNLIARGLQDHKSIEFAGYKLEHLLIRDVLIEYVTNGGKSINEILKDVLLDYIKLYENIEVQINKLIN